MKSVCGCVRLLAAQKRVMKGTRTHARARFHYIEVDDKNVMQQIEK